MPEEQTKEKEQLVVLGTADSGAQIVVGEFSEGEAKGLKYAYPVVTSGAMADAQFGAEETANLINAAVKIRIANKVKTTKIPANVQADTFAAEMSRMANGIVDGIAGLIFSLKEALEYKPGERTPGVKAQVENKIAEAVEKVKAGGLTPEESMAILQEIASLQARRQKK